MSIVRHVPPAVAVTAESQRQIADSLNQLIDKVQPFGVVTATGTLTVSGVYGTYLADASATAMTLFLPPALAHKNREYKIVKVDGTANVVLVDGNASETINGSITIQTATQYAGWTLASDGTKWVVIP